MATTPHDMPQTDSPRMHPVSPGLFAARSPSPRTRVTFETPLALTTEIEGPNLYNPGAQPELPAGAPVATPMHRRLTITPPKPRAITPPKPFVHPASMFPSVRPISYDPLPFVSAAAIDDKESLCDMWKNNPKFNPTKISADSARKRWARTSTRTKRRWRNDRLVGTFVQDCPPTADELKDFMTNRTPSSHFAALLEPQNAQLLEKFISCSLDDAPHPTTSRQHPTAQTETGMFAHLSSKVRPLFENPRPNTISFVTNIETQLVQLAEQTKSENDAKLELKLSSLHRLLAKGVCEFYGIKAKSVDTESGDRVVVITFSKGSVCPSDANPKLSEVLTASAN